MKKALQQLSNTLDNLEEKLKHEDEELKLTVYGMISILISDVSVMVSALISEESELLKSIEQRKN